jgi:hemoglobin
VELTPFHKIGEKNLQKLIHNFYAEVKKDALLAPLYKGDFEGAEKRLYLFMMQYLGGPDTYSQQRGHPALRKRHIPFPVNDQTVERWLTCMEKALMQAEIKPEQKAFLRDYFHKTAHFLKNR